MSELSKFILFVKNTMNVMWGTWHKTYVECPNFEF